MAYTTDPLDALLFINNGSLTARWNFPDAVGSSLSNPAGIGNAVTVTYSFLSGVPSYTASDGSGFQAFDSMQRAATRQVLDWIEKAIDVDFVETTGIGQMTFGNSSQSTSQSGYAYFPGYGYRYSGTTIVSTSESATAGDVWINRNSAWTADSWQPGGWGVHTLFHEIGHALGLKHSFSGTWLLDPQYDDTRFTVMSYTEPPNSTAVTVSGTSSSYSWRTSTVAPESLMVMDLVALQYLYGANTAGHAGNDTYRWGTNEEFFETIWDAGGNDTIDCANQIFTCNLNLEDYSYSSIGLRQTDAELRQGLDLPSWFLNPLPSDVYDGWSNLGIAWNTTIENAIGGSGNDTISGNGVANRLYGKAGNDTLSGAAGNDVLDGGTGADSMSGGTGNDVFYVDNTGDRVLESAGQGTDTAYSLLSALTLAANVENGRILATGSANMTGNALNNVIYAGSGNNVMAGGSGTDTLSYAYAKAGVAVNLALATAQATGGSGTDTVSGFESLVGSAYADKLTGTTGANVLTGGAGNDVLNGGAGADTMSGGTGNDAFYVDNTGDRMLEGSGQGTDTAYSSLSALTLAANVENGRILATGSANMTGNALNNVIYAGSGNNVMAGGSGTDTLSYAYAKAGVAVSLARTTAQSTIGSGSDTLSGFERLAGSSYGDTLTGGGDNNVLSGGAGNDRLSGGGGNDSMVGGTGQDRLTGGTGNDIFDFNALAETGLSATSRDIVLDFVRGQDRIDLSTIDANAALGGNNAFTFIGGAAFGSNAAGQLRYVWSASDGYGVLYGSTDADAAAEFSIQIAGVSGLASSDFLL